MHRMQEVRCLAMIGGARAWRNSDVPATVWALRILMQRFAPRPASRASNRNNSSFKPDWRSAPWTEFRYPDPLPRCGRRIRLNLLHKTARPSEPEQPPPVGKVHCGLAAARRSAQRRRRAVPARLLRRARQVRLPALGPRMPGRMPKRSATHCEKPQVTRMRDSSRWVIHPQAEGIQGER
jgi:hypothetical protein